METITQIQEQYIARKTLIASAIVGIAERFAMERFARQEAHRKLADCGLTGAQIAQALKDAVDVFELNMHAAVKQQ